MCLSEKKRILDFYNQNTVHDIFIFKIGLMTRYTRFRYNTIHWTRCRRCRYCSCRWISIHTRATIVNNSPILLIICRICKTLCCRCIRNIRPSTAIIGWRLPFYDCPCMPWYWNCTCIECWAQRHGNSRCGCTTYWGGRTFNNFVTVIATSWIAHNWGLPLSQTFILIS